MKSADNHPATGSGGAPLTWPEGFLWGVSTSSYQIEGAAKEDGRGPSVWDLHCRQKDRVANGDTGEVACDHYHRYPEDVTLMKDIGIGAYRFSVAWPRVLPRGRGAANGKGLDFYDRLLDKVLEAGIEPWLCLYHWDLPQGLNEMGGWLNRDIAGWFADYTALVARRYGDRVKRFATFNEPSVFTIFGYGLGWNAPAIADRAALLKSVHHVNLAHGAAVDVVRSLVPDVSIGAVHNCQPVVPERDTPEDKQAAEILDEYWNYAYPDPQCLGVYPPYLAEAIEPYTQPGDMARICRPVDWFGLNHYSPIYARGDGETPLGFRWGDAPPGVPRSDIGWPFVPDAFRAELVRLHKRYRLPIYVTENGTGGGDTLDETGNIDDQHRIRYLDAYTRKMHEAIAEGADVRGYFVWSLLDNFEWGSGYVQRFGLVHVDYETQKRTMKGSGRWYQALIKSSRKVMESA
ncbi:MAG TPA: GH1 family beta-glucosidase [Azospirillaceae bacterium]|nr:GH1 family beta-glucosidase [Azospirillaceae bacterium]